jgi:hypothetical protein
VSLPHSKSNSDPSDGQNKGKTNPSTWKELESGPDRIGKQDQDLVCDRIWVLGVLVLIPIGSRNRISELLIEKCVIGLYLLYTSQNLLGTIFRVTFAVLYRRIWSIVGNYSILCCDTYAIGPTTNNRSTFVPRDSDNKGGLNGSWWSCYHIGDLSLQDMMS